MNMRYALSFGLALVLALTACTQTKSNLSTPTPALPSVLSAGQTLSQIKSKETPFELYRLLASSPQNINLSPLSLKLSFALLYRGSSGNTESTLEKIFGFSKTETSVFDAEFKLADSIATKNSANEVFEISNAIWFKDLKSVTSEYREALKNLRTEIKHLTPNDLNTWLESKTEISPQSQIVITSRVNLKMPWANAFSTADTRLGEFRSSPHLTRKVQILHRTGQYRYFENELAQWIEMPYSNSDFALQIILPKKVFDLRKIEETLSSDHRAEVENKMKLTEVALSIPKFSFTQNKSLKELMVNAGYGNLFTASPDFKKMSSAKNLQISDLIQSSAVRVTEEGTEVLTNTSLAMADTKLSLSSPEAFNANQPFIFILENKKSHEIYNLGRVLDPASP